VVLTPISNEAQSAYMGNAYVLLCTGTRGVPRQVSRLALIAACQLLIIREQNKTLAQFQPFLSQALLYACKVKPPSITKQEVKASFW
jgi:hypothetical protein